MAPKKSSPGILVPRAKKILVPRGHAEVERAAKRERSGMPANWFFMTLPSLLAATKQLVKPFAQVSWVYSCVDARAINLSQAPFVVVTGSRADQDDPGKKVPETHPLQRLFHRPTPALSETQFWQLISIWMDLAGEAFLYPTDISGEPVSLTSETIPESLWPIPPNCLNVAKVNSYGMATHWRIQLGQSETIIPAENLLHLRLPNPYDPNRGLAPMEAANMTASIDYKANQFTENLMDSGGEPGGILSTDYELGKEHVKELQQRWEDRHRGASKAGRVAILTGGLRYEKTGTSHKEMEFAEQRKWSREEILAIFRTPAIILGLIQDVNRTTAHVAMNLFWKSAILPRMRIIQDELWTKFFMPRARAPRQARGTIQWGRFDLSGVEALRDSYTERLEQADKLVQLGYPLNMVNKKLDLGMPDVDWGREPLSDPNKVPITMLFDFPGRFVSSTGDQDEKDEKAKTDDTPRDQGQGLEGGDDERAKKAPRIRRLRSREAEGRRMAAYLFRRYITPAEEILYAPIDDYFGRTRQMVMNGFGAIAKRALPPNSPLTEAEIDAILQAASRWEGAMRSAIGSTLDSVAMTAVDSLLDELRGFTVISPDLNEAWIRSGVARRIAGLVRLAKKDRETLRAAIIDAISNRGLTDITALQEAVSRIMESYPAFRTARIARTEAGMLSNQLRYHGMLREGVERHTWRNSRDEFVRPVPPTGNPANHRKMEGQTVRLGTKFSNGLLYPMDPNGAAGEVIECRCLAVAEVD